MNTFVTEDLAQCVIGHGGVEPLNLTVSVTVGIKIKKKIKNSVRTWVCLATAGMLSSSVFAFSQSTNAPAGLDYSAFKIIAERNIFNPNRHARGSPPPRSTNRTQPASKIESFTLVGLMEFEKGTFAFFDGTSPGYHKTLQTSGEIAGHKLALVNPRLVRLVEGTNQFELQVGQQLRREDGSEWFVADANGGNSRRRTTSSRGRIYEGLATSSNGGEVVSSDATAEPEVIVVEADPNASMADGENGVAAPAETEHSDNAGSEITDPVLRRLMERRQQEMNR